MADLSRVRAEPAHVAPRRADLTDFSTRTRNQREAWSRNFPSGRHRVSKRTHESKTVRADRGDLDVGFSPAKVKPGD